MPRPAHRLIAGSFPAIEPLFLAEVTRLKGDDPLAPVEVLAGSNLLGVYLRRRLAAERGAVANLRFLTFVDLAREMAPGLDPRPALPPLGEERLAQVALRETPEAARFEPLRDRAALARTLLATADDLRDAGVPLDRLTELLTGAATTDDRRDLLGAVGATLAALEAGRGLFSDVNSLLQRAAHAEAPRRAPLLVYGITDLGGLRGRVLARAASARPVTAFVPVDGFEEDDLGLSPPVRVALFESLLGAAAERAEEPGRTAVLTTVIARDETDEARETVREIVSASEAGIPLHRMAVVLRHPDTQEPPLLAELRRLAIPFFRPAGPGFSKRPLGRAAQLLFRLAAEGMTGPAFLELVDLLEALALFPALGLGRATPAGIARAAGDAGTMRGVESFAGRIEAARQRLARPLGAVDDPDGIFEGRRAHARERLNGLDTAFRAVAEALPGAGPAPWAVWGERLAGSFRSLLGKHPESKRLADAAGVLAGLSQLDDAPATASEVLRLLPEALDLDPLTAGRFERDGVAILSSVSARGLLFGAVFVPGLVERSIPAPARPDPLLFDEERARLRQAGFPVASRAGTHHAREERFLFETACRSAGARLVLLAARHDTTKDRDRLLSPFLLDRLEARAGRTLTGDDLAEEAIAAPLGVRRLALGRVVGDGPAIDAEEVVRRALPRGPIAPARAEGLGEALGRALRRAAAKRSPRFTAHEGLLGRASRLLDPFAKPLSAHRLERLAGCAYRTFFAEALRLEPRDDENLSFSPDRLEAGNIAHAVLRDLARAGGFGRRDAVGALVARHVEAWGAAGELDLPPVFLEKARADVEAIVGAVLDFESARLDPLRFAGAEIRFGPARSDPDERDEDPALSRDASPSLEAGGKVFAFAGKIDRLDRAGTRARVVDYKVSRALPYGKKNEGERIVAGGERVQLPIYALAARALGAEEVESEYLFVPNEKGVREVTPRRFDPARTRRAIELLGEVLEAAADVFDRGLFLPKTRSARSPDPCATCDFKSICGPGHAAVYARKWEGDAGTAAPLAALEAIP